MNNRLDLLLTRMPSHFAKDENSNNYKLLSLIAQGSEEKQAVYDAMLKFWDVDQSEGVGLDRLGKDEGISRGNWEDEEYRKMIKIQCITNMSDGDIPTMNLILDAYMGENFIGISEGFGQPFFEPASLIGHIKDGAKIPRNVLVKRIKPAGVKFHWLCEFISKTIILNSSVKFSYPIPLPICGTFHCDGIPGKGNESTIELHKINYTYPVHLPITGEIYPNEVMNEW